MKLRDVRLGEGGEHGLDRSGSGQRQMAGSCESGNKPSGSIKYGKYLEYLRTC
jgi:hypothetical protein